jgi:hypothetical protein
MGPVSLRLGFFRLGVQSRFGLGSVVRSEVPEQPRLTRLVLGKRGSERGTERGSDVLELLRNPRFGYSGTALEPEVRRWQERFGKRLGFPRNGTGSRGSAWATVARK